MTRYEEKHQTAPPHEHSVRSSAVPGISHRPAPEMPASMPGLSQLSRLLPERIGELETEDIILLLILYLMYRESGDSELLVIMGGMFLL